jgi:hypothetical protein
MRAPDQGCLAKPVLFIDRSLGNKTIPAALRQCPEIIVEVHDDHFPPNTQDEDLLLAIGRRGWIFITKDKRIRYSPLAQAAIRKTGAIVLYLSTKGDLSGTEMADILKKAIKSIVGFYLTAEPPIIAKITREGKVSEPIKL